MNIPVDEMLTELRAVLEKFDREPTWENLDRVSIELRRIQNACEEALPE